MRLHWQFRLNRVEMHSVTAASAASHWPRPSGAPGVWGRATAAAALAPLGCDLSMALIFGAGTKDNKLELES